MAMTRKKRIEKIEKDYGCKFKKELPKNYENWAEKNIFHKYLVYDSKTATCKVCNESFSKKEIKIKHNEKGRCPKCNAIVYGKALGRIKNGFEDLFWSEIYDIVDNKDIYIRHIRHFRCYNSNGDVKKTYINNQVRTVLTDTECKSFFLYQEGFDEWRNYMGSCYSTPSEYYVPRNAKIYNRNLEKKIEAIDKYKYSAVNRFIKDMKNKDGYTTDCSVAYYLNSYKDNTWFEKLVKVGMSEIVYSLIRQLNSYYNKNTVSNLIDKQANRVHDLLKLSVEEYRMLKKIGAKYDNWRNIVNYRGLGLKEANFRFLAKCKEITREECRAGYLSHEYALSPSDLKCLTQYMGPTKALLMGAKYPVIFKDYINLCEKMEFDMKSKSVLFPKDVKKAHDDILEAYNAVKEEINKKAFKKAIAKFGKFLAKCVDKEKFVYENDKYTILIPKNGKEIANEGSALSHCVKGYIDSVADQKTNILFIRKKGEENKSFFTMEWRDGRIIQCHGYRNCNPDAELKKFIDKFNDILNYYLMNRKPMPVEKAA